MCKEETTSVWISVVGSSDTTGWADRCYAGGTATSGTREYLLGGDLGDGSIVGSVCVGCWNWLDWTYWDCAARD